MLFGEKAPEKKQNRKAKAQKDGDSENQSSSSTNKRGKLKNSTKRQSSVDPNLNSKMITLGNLNEKGNKALNEK